ncbi:MAG: glycosyltransferase family 39 protein [Proteobacteria bacterium]|nr:glycosyltransferase family 39 protein [Pseudomonadota bacterium]
MLRFHDRIQGHAWLRGSALPRRGRYAAGYLAAVAVLGLLCAWLRQPALEQDVFRNEDVAGITYNADLLRHGKLPLVDSLEIKEPGSYFVTAGLWRVFGRSLTVLQTFGVFWAWLAAVGVLVAGQQLFGLSTGVLAALLYTLLAPISDSLDVNYNAWMMTPCIWGLALFALGLRRGRLGWFVAAGIAVTVSAVFKRQAGLAAPAYVLVLLILPSLRAAPARAAFSRRRALAAYIVGGLVGLLPIATFYALHGQLGALLHQFFMSEGGWGYVRGEVDWSGRWERLEDGVLGLWEYLSLPGLLAALSLAALPLRRRSNFSAAEILLVLHLACDALAASVGFRFYKSYYQQLLPPLVLLAAHPQGVLLRWFSGAARRACWPELARRLALVGLLVVLGVPAALRSLAEVRHSLRTRNEFSTPHYEARQIASFIARHTQPTERIWIWGRWGWPIYYHADRLAPTRFYKVLGVVTTNLTNTWRRPTEMTRFVPRGPWRELAAELKQTLPPFIVTANNESYAGFTPFESLLRQSYRPLSGAGLSGFVVWVRSDRQVRWP